MNQPCIQLRTTRKPIPLPVKHRRWRPPKSSVVIQLIATCRSRSSSAASVTPIFIRCATSGASSWPRIYPIVPGHEIVGRVTKVGSAVTKYKPGDLAAVGCMVDSDRTCPNCKAGLEQFCPNMVLTFNSPDKHLGGCHLRRLFRKHRRRRTFRSARPVQSRIPPGPRRCFALGSRPTRRCATGVWARARKSAWSVSAGLATWP